VAFRIQDLMMDVRPARAQGADDGYQMANPECTCQITVKTGAQREAGMLPDEEPEVSPDPEQDSEESPDCPPEQSALAAGLAQLKAQLRRDLGLGL
jgi:hypothetical protein